MIPHFSLVGQHVALRPLEPSDAPLVAACNNDPEVRTSFFTHKPVSIESQRARIATYYEPGADYIPFAICRRDDGLTLGVTALHRVDWISRATSFSICIAAREGRGKGYGREATELMVEYCFDVLGLHRMQLHVWDENSGGIRIYEACGFQREGLLREAMQHQGRFCNFLVMGLLEPEWRAARAAR